jgi:hypothetical protein
MAEQGQTQALLYEDFCTNVFGSGEWIASDNSVSVDLDSCWLRIGSNGTVDDFADKFGPFPLPLVIEWRERTFTGAGSYFSLPKLEFWWGPSSNDSYHITYVQDDQSGNPADDGWLFGSWSDNHTLGTTAWDQWRTVRVIIRSDGGELFAKQDGDLDFTPIVTATWTIPNVIERIRLAQNSDDVSDFDYVKVCSAGLTEFQAFSTSNNYSAGSRPPVICSADFDDNDCPDLAVTNAFASHVFILLNNCDATGTYAPAATYPVASGSWGISPVDLDGDLDLDLAVGSYTSTRVSLLFNDGTGSFIPGPTYTLSGAGGVVSVFPGDFDGDNDMDMAVSSDLLDRVFLLMNNGDGTLQQGNTDYSTGRGRVQAVTGADVNSDGSLDLVLAGISTVSILLGDGSGAFMYGDEVDMPTNSVGRSITPADLDQDLDIDLAVALGPLDRLAVLLNDGAGIFQLPTMYPTADQPYASVASDLDLDGDMDLAVACWAADSVSLFENRGDGGFLDRVYVPTGDGSQWIVSADVDGDRDYDLATSNDLGGNVSVLLNLLDTSPPVITCPPDILVECVSPSGAEVIFESSASDDEDCSPRIVCEPPSGSVFPIGNTAVTCTATDASGNASTCTFTVTVTQGAGSISGVIAAPCETGSAPLLSVPVDVFDAQGDLVASSVSQTDGSFRIDELPSGAGYTVSIVPPLDYRPDYHELGVQVLCGEASTVDFHLACLEIVARPRTIGFWKHQVGVALGGKGAAQVDAATLCHYLDLIATHFNSNSMNQVVIYEPPVSGACADKISVAKALLNLKGDMSMTSRARQQLTALLLNVAAQYISLAEVVSDDGATLSQAITYCDHLLDDPWGDHEKAQMICDEINNGRRLPAGIIPLETANIAYKMGPQSFWLSQAFPNPFNPTTSFTLRLPEAMTYVVTIYNITGQTVKTIAGEGDAGVTTITWDGTDSRGVQVASGMYFYRLRAGEFVDTKKMLLLK